jgi:hypothetical protein
MSDPIAAKLEARRVYNETVAPFTAALERACLAEVPGPNDSAVKEQLGMQPRAPDSEAIRAAKKARDDAIAEARVVYEKALADGGVTKEHFIISNDLGAMRSRK